MIKGYSSSQKTGPQKYATIQPLGAGKYGTEVLPKALTEVLLIDQIPEVGSTEDTIVLTGHSVKAGDILRFNGGFLDYQEVTVESVTANTIKLAHKFDQPITAAETFRFLRTVTLTISKEGNLATSSGPLQFVRDGAAQQVIEDTVTPANNVPLPVKLSSVTGDINITANDLNVQLQHDTLNPDSVQIGNGTNIMDINATGQAQVEVGNGANIMAVNATGEASVVDATARTTLASILAQLQELNKPIYRLGGSFAASLPLDVTTGALIHTVPASVVITEIELSYKNGDPISIYDAATGGNFIGRVTSGGGMIKLKNLPTGTQLYLRAGVSNFSAIDMTVNINGKDV